MQAKSGKTVSVVNPTAPVEVFEADVAKPGQAAKVKAKQRETKQGKYGVTKAPAFKPPSPDNAEDDDASESQPDGWIEIVMLDEAGEPVAGEKYEVELPDGTVASGTLGSNGEARIEGFESGNCKVSFPNLDKSAWEQA